MDSSTVCSYRCFGEEQTARLAPITLLVGENSTGKSSLMAMIRALWDAVYADRAPDFKEEPYDPGSFERHRARHRWPWSARQAFRCFFRGRCRIVTKRRPIEALPG